MNHFSGFAKYGKKGMPHSIGIHELWMNHEWRSMRCQSGIPKTI